MKTLQAAMPLIGDNEAEEDELNIEDIFENPEDVDLSDGEDDASEESEEVASEKAPAEEEAPAEEDAPTEDAENNQS